MTKVYRTLKKREKIIRNLQKKGYVRRSLGLAFEIFEHKDNKDNEVYVVRG